MVKSSWPMVQGSWLMPQRSWLKAKKNSALTINNRLINEGFDYVLLVLGIQSFKCHDPLYGGYPDLVEKHRFRMICSWRGSPVDQKPCNLKGRYWLLRCFILSCFFNVFWGGYGFFNYSNMANWWFRTYPTTSLTTFGTFPKLANHWRFHFYRETL